MPKSGNRLGRELQRLKKRKGTGYKDIWENLKNRAAEISKAPPYDNPLSLTRFFHGTRKPPRSKLLQILAWGFEVTDVREINRALKLSEYEALSKKERAGCAGVRSTNASLTKVPTRRQQWLH